MFHKYRIHRRFQRICKKTENSSLIFDIFCLWNDNILDMLGENFFNLIYLFRGEGKEKERRETLMHGCSSCVPDQGPGLQLRYMTWLGIEPATLWSADPRSIHWATPARAVVWNIKINFTFLVCIMWLLENSKLPMGLTLLACVIFLLHSCSHDWLLIL